MFKSESQHRKFRILLDQGKITKSKFDEWMQETKDSAEDKQHPIKGLPERVKKAFLVKVSDLIPGGYADDKSDEEFDKEQINKGIKVEQEHTNDKAKAKEIAKDHLTEHADYYDDLAMAEDAMKLEDKTGKEVEYHLTNKPEEKESSMRFNHEEEKAFFKGFSKSAGIRLLSVHKQGGKLKSIRVPLTTALGAGGLLAGGAGLAYGAKKLNDHLNKKKNK